MSKIERVLNALNTGEELSAAQIEARFDIGNVRALMSSLRMNGYPVYANQRTNEKGQTKTFYRLGTPSRAVIAAGYRALAAA